MGKFIDWLFEKGDTETAKDRVFKNTSNEEVSGHVVDFLATNRKGYITRKVFVGSENFEIRLSIEDVETCDSDKLKTMDLAGKYLREIQDKMEGLGYFLDIRHSRVSEKYFGFDRHVGIDETYLVERLAMFTENIFFVKNEENIAPTVELLGVKYDIDKTEEKYYKYKIKNFEVAQPCSHKLFIILSEIETKITEVTQQKTSDQENFDLLLNKTLEENHQFQEYVINKSLSKFKIKIKEQTDDVATDMLKIEVMNQIKEDFYQYSHTVYIEKKRLYELIKNDSTFEEILEVK